MAVQRDDDYPVTPTLEEQVADAIRVWMAKIAAGVCPHCGMHMTRRQHGTDVYAWPCQHYLYQGSVDIVPQ